MSNPLDFSNIDFPEVEVTFKPTFDFYAALIVAFFLFVVIPFAISKVK